jgi:hypothetical protein
MDGNQMHYENFGLPQDGLTRVEDLDGYRTDRLEADGWTMVGVCWVPTDGGGKTMGVYRLSESAAIQLSSAKLKAAQEAQEEARKDLREVRKELEISNSSFAKTQIRAEGAAEVHRVVKFLRDRLKSGEGWTPQCDDMMGRIGELEPF